jgi:branched-chain amino acid transport system substrate-binding protein
MNGKTKNNETDLMRRSLFKAAALTGAAAATSLPLLNIAHASTAVIKIGYVTSLSGIRATFGEADLWNLGKFKQEFPRGLTIGSKNYRLEIVIKDNRSDPARSTVVGNELIFRDKVDMILIQDLDAAQWLGDLCDANGIPTISTMLPWQGWMFGRKGSPDKGFPYTFHFFWGVDDMYRNFLGIWNSTKVNRTVGTTYVDGPLGRAFSDATHGLPGLLKKGGYKEVPGGLFNVETEDFSKQVDAFAKGGASIVSGFVFSDHWSSFWKQATKVGYKPEICTVAAAFLFPSAINSLGERGDGMSTEVWWTPSFPFRSSITGQTARELASEWERYMGMQWTQPLGYGHALWEIALAALRNAADPKDKKALRDSIANLAVDTIIGPVRFKNSPVKNVAITSTVGGQWRKTRKGSKFPNELLIVNNETATQIPVDTEFKLLSQLR